ncbi:hypothetical protein M433DRAFT_152905 [Acidomyces richmondensis BFW]|nr:hypothetical protein M433DRAFT_152905 [Acidomyces richmondensis BFW]
MVLGHSIRKNSLASNRPPVDDGSDGDEEIVGKEEGSILTHIISQLRPGADLSRVTLPTFILEPRSMLERITNFMAHPELLLPIATIDDPLQRFVAVTRFYLSGWHIKPPGVKKPLNPILGETFTGWWDYPDGTRGFYIAEQTSHHPPKSSYFFMAPEHKIRIDGTLKPRSKFLGNSVGSFMEGIAIMRFLNRGERYFVTQPNMYARGILFGKMKYELGDHAIVRCPETGFEVDIEFKVKGWMGGTYNAIGGFIKQSDSGRKLYELSGYWHGEMYIKDLTTGKTELLFDATHAKPTPVKARPLSEQSPRESQRLWDPTTRAIKRADQKTATEEKTKIEDEQRREAAERGEESWHPKLFKAAPPGDEQSLDWIINARVDDDAPPQKQIEQILAIAPILPGQQVSRDSKVIEHMPSQEEKRPPQETRQQQQDNQQSGDGSGDLIDFGQNDGSSNGPVESCKKSSAATNHDLTEGMNQMNLQQPLQPTRSEGPGWPVKRMDSLGNEDTFVDAES